MDTLLLYLLLSLSTLISSKKPDFPSNKVSRANRIAYKWTNVRDQGLWKKSYNFQMFNHHDTSWVFHTDGNWLKYLCIISFILLIQATRTSPEPVTFVASTPCDMIPRSALSIPANADCEFIKWNLALQRDPRSQVPTTYTLRYTYGMSQPNTMEFRNGGTRLIKEGKWSIQQDTRSRDVYQLQSNTPETTISLVKLDDKLLHLLDPAGNLMIGHAGWSYTLNRK